MTGATTTETIEPLLPVRTIIGIAVGGFYGALTILHSVPHAFLSNWMRVDILHNLGGRNALDADRKSWRWKSC